MYSTGVRQMNIIEKTINTVKRINDYLYMMEFNCPYSLDTILKGGKTGIIPLARQLQKEIKTNSTLVKI